jgi:RNA polymerase sigma-70 factor (ECF subfamily)
MEIMRVGVQTAIDSVPAQATRPDASARFDEAFTLHHRVVFAMARTVVRDAALAEEITQEVFLKLYRHLDSAPGADLMRPWLLRITLNEARNTIRSRSRALVRDTNYQRRNNAEAAMQTDSDSRELDAVRRALDKIKEPMRSCLLLRHQGLSYREIAQTLSLKESYVGSLVARARKEFARTYGKIGVNR